MSERRMLSKSLPENYARPVSYASIAPGTAFCGDTGRPPGTAGGCGEQVDGTRLFHFRLGPHFSRGKQIGVAELSLVTRARRSPDDGGKPVSPGPVTRYGTSGPDQYQDSESRVPIQ